MQETVWDFRGGHLPGQWRISGLDVPQTTLEGLRIRASAQDGSLISDVAIPHAVQVITLTFRSAQNIQAQFLWHQKGVDPGLLVQLPFTIPRTQGEHAIHLNLEAYPQWDGTTDVIGLMLPKGTDLLLQEIRFTRWNVLEQAMHAATSFWTFDRMHATSINFIWGPVIVGNPFSIDGMFENMPPQGRSGMWIGYVLIAMAAIAAAVTGIWRRQMIDGLRRIGITRVPGGALLFLLGFAMVWALFDLRMGLELLGYARHDYRTYLAAAPGQRTFRTFLNFNDAADRTMPYLIGEERLGLLTTPTTPVRDMLRYFAFPTIVMEPSGPDPDLDLWFVFYRNDASVDTEGRLTIGGTPWTWPGEIVERFDAASFLFRTNE